MTPVHKSKIYVCQNIPNSTLTCVSFGPRRAGIILLLSESEKRKEKCISVTRRFAKTDICCNTLIIPGNQDSNSHHFTFII